MNAVIYARYSSDSQREESIDGQLRECKAFAVKNDFQIIGTYIDRALSAKTDNRPDFQKMIKDSASGKFEAIIVWKLDRFARNRYDSAHYKSVLRKNGVKIVSATEIISDNPEGILLESMLEGMAEYYSAELAEKVIRGLKENALKCKYNGGNLPIGYTTDSNQCFQIDPLTAPIVLDAFKHYADGATMREITDEMNIRGVRTKRGGKININCVTRMLHNRKYIGEYKYRDVLIEGGIPAIIPKDLFDRVQKRMAQTKKAPAKHKAEDEYLLTTKLFCGKCKCLMVGESGTSHTMKVHRYYKCVSVKNHRGCDKKTVKKEWIENLVIEQIQKVIFNEELVNRLADAIIDLQSKENIALPLLHKQFAEVQKSIDNMLSAIEQGILTASTKERLEALEERKNELSVQIIKEAMAKPTLTKEQIIFWVERFRKFNTKHLDHRRRLIDSFVNAIYLYDDKMIITFNYKDGTQTIPFEEIEKSEIGSDINSVGAPLLFGSVYVVLSLFIIQ
ncbi:MAG: recombinase family protein [Clostridia bacterium]|nr:recombinase family protein [Clostridia bacterium]